MSDRQRVYNEVLKTLKGVMKQQMETHVVTLAMMICGIVLGKKAQLSAMSSEIPHTAKDASIERRMVRFVKNERIDVAVYYMPFAQALLAHLASAPLLLVMDASVVGRGCMVLMVGVVYKQRALPLAWIVYQGKKGHASASKHIEVLELVLPLIPQGVDVTLLGDGEYDNIAMLVWIETHTDWHFVVRTPASSLIQYGGKTVNMAGLMVECGEKIVIEQAFFTAAAFGPLRAIAWWGKEYDAPLYLISNLADGAHACDCYRRRYRIETLFSDEKSRGFHIHQSHLSAPSRLNRLLLAACLAFLWVVHLGVSVVAQGLSHLIDRTERTDKSLFRLGLDWLKHLLKYGKSIPVLFSPSPPDLYGVR